MSRDHMAAGTVIIIGAGPAGLTAGYEFVTRTGIKPVILEAGQQVGGLSKTIHYKGNRMDLGGHRFFSKSDRVVEWWLTILRAGEKNTPERSPENLKRMLLRQRISRIFFMKKFFDYPVTLNVRIVRNLGFSRLMRILSSYLAVMILPKRKENSLEDFLVNRFGKELYKTFFRDYTEKVWGVPCSRIRPEWGAQRIKGMSVGKVIAHALQSFAGRKGDIRNHPGETSLIGQFMYPALGPGQLWEEVAGIIREKGGEIHTGYRVQRILTTDGRITAVEAVDAANGLVKRFEGDHFISTMPVKELIEAFDAPVPEEVRDIAGGLVYRDFITVGLLLKQLVVKDGIQKERNMIPDCWIYIQERNVRVGRVQIFNNWSPYMVAEPERVWLGMEYFCNEGDDLWNLPDGEMIGFASEELVALGFARPEDILDGVAVHVPKAYPAYFGTYDRIERVREFTERFENLWLIGRNGMHRYNNQDHSMLTAMEAVGNIATGKKTRGNIWEVNTEADYHEVKS